MLESIKLTLGNPVSSHSLIISINLVALAAIYSGLNADIKEFSNKALKINILSNMLKYSF